MRLACLPMHGTEGQRLHRGGQDRGRCPRRLDHGLEPWLGSRSRSAGSSKTRVTTRRASTCTGHRRGTRSWTAATSALGASWTDQIKARIPAAVAGADVLVVQGGINDIVQGRAVELAANDLRTMVKEGKAEGLRVVIADVLPWNNGGPDAEPADPRVGRDPPDRRSGRHPDAAVLRDARGSRAAATNAQEWTARGPPVGRGPQAVGRAGLLHRLKPGPARAFRPPRGRRGSGDLDGVEWLQMVSRVAKEVVQHRVAGWKALELLSAAPARPERSEPSSSLLSREA